MDKTRVGILIVGLAVLLGRPCADAANKPPIAVALADGSGRMVFRNTEKIRLAANVDMSLPWTVGLPHVSTASMRIPGWLVADLRPKNRLNQSELFNRQVPQDGRAEWEVNLAGFEPGPYEFRVAYVTVDGGIELAQGVFDFHVVERATGREYFPIVNPLTPLPDGPGWSLELPASKLDQEVIRASIDNLIAHGFTGLEYPFPYPRGFPDVPKELLQYAVDYAQARGMLVMQLYGHGGNLEGFRREGPASPSVYSPQYPDLVRAKVTKFFGPMSSIPRLYNVFPYMDEPFNVGTTGFDNSPEAKAEFKKRYGYDLPVDINAIRDDPKKWLDVLNFRTDYFSDAWEVVYKIIKQVAPDYKVIINHDSHNSLGGAVHSHGEMFIDDIFHWRGDWADMYAFDIYPYDAEDFRYGQCGMLRRPRMSQLHFGLAQLRNVTETYHKELAFWVGQYGYGDFMRPAPKAQYWSERETAYTAIAGGADFLWSEFDKPLDAHHWDHWGEGLRVIQKVGGPLVAAKRPKANACWLFPRTQGIQLQEEYFDVGQAYEAFQRAFGELDAVHEEQVKGGKLDEYKILVMFDVKLLPEDVAEGIAAWVRKGGILIADSVPNLGRYRQPMKTMEELFGVRDAETERIIRTGMWEPYGIAGPRWFFPKDPKYDETKFKTDAVRGTVFGVPLDMTLISPRPAKIISASVLLKTASGQPAMVQRRVGKGQVFLLGFCLQDTYFQAWKEELDVSDQPEAGLLTVLNVRGDPKFNSRAQIYALLRAMTKEAGVRSHVYSSNPDIEAGVRQSDKEGFVLVINHETERPKTEITLADLRFAVAKVVDVADDKDVPFEQKDGTVVFHLDVPLGDTRLLHLYPAGK